MSLTEALVKATTETLDAIEDVPLARRQSIRRSLITLVLSALAADVCEYVANDDAPVREDADEHLGVYVDLIERVIALTTAARGG